MNRTTYRVFNGIAIGLSAIFGLTLLAIILTSDDTPSPAPAAGDAPPAGTPSEDAPPTLDAAEPLTVIPPTAPAPGPDSLAAATLGEPTNLRAGPGLDFPIVASLSASTPLTVVGRWVGYDWYMVYWPEAPAGSAWVYAPLVQVQGDPNLLPPVEPPPFQPVSP